MTIEATLFALTNSLQPVRRAWLQVVNRVLADADAQVPTPLAIAILLVARLGPHVQQKTLALELGVNPAGMVRILDQGEMAGLLVREHPEHDRRGKIVRLLPDGERLAERCERALAALRYQLIGDTAQNDVETAIRILRRLEERANQWMQAPTER